MDPALIKLMLLQGKALRRRSLRGLTTLRGAIFFLFGLMMFGLWVVGVAIGARTPRPSPVHVRSVAPLILLGICLVSALTSAGDKAVAFTPGEVDFLFPGPFSRRQLLIYKLGKSAIAALLTGLILSFALLRNATLWIACYVGIFLSLLFIQFLSTALVLLAQTVSEKAWSRGRRLVIGAVVLLAVLGFRTVMAGHSLSGPNAIDVPELLQQFGRTQTGEVLLAPFNVFGQAITAQRVFPDLASWASVAALIDVALLGLIIRLDSNYLEAAAGASQRRYARIQRVRSGGMMTLGSAKTARRSLPRFPFFFGAGPIAWRQLTSATRSARGLLVVIVVLAACLGPFFLAARQPHAAGGPTTRAVGSISIKALLSTLGWFSVLLASLLRFDFRADLDPMESLKTLPLRAWAIAAGQLVAPVVVLTVTHFILIVAVWNSFTTSHGDRVLLAAGAALSLPFNLLLFAAENLTFLLFPTRPAAVGPGDFQILGRQIFTLGLRTLIVVFGAGIAAGVAIIAYSLSGDSSLVLTSVAALVMIIEAAALTPAIGWAFSRFDPSMHMPGA